MAIFNPEVKDVKGVNPIGWSHSADVPGSFASGLAESIKGIGSLISQGAKVGDELVKQDIERAATENIEPIKDDEISRLAGEDFKLKLAALDTGTATDETSSPVPGTLQPGVVQGLGTLKPEEAVPGDLKSDLRNLAILPDARANGKLSPTDYYGRLLSAAKDLRSKYPVGYRDYIDKEISKITGVDPANAYMHSLIGDINAFQTNAQAEKNKILGKLMEVLPLDPENSTKMYQGFASGKVSQAAALEYIARNEAVDVYHRRTMAKFAESKATEEVNTVNASTSLKEYSAEKLNTLLQNTSEVNGLTPEVIADLQERALKGDVNRSSPEWIAYSNMMKGHLQSYVRGMAADIRKNPAWNKLGPEATKIVDDQTAVMKEIIKGFDDKNIGLVFSTKNAAEAYQSDATFKLFGDQKIGNHILFMGAVRKELGEDAASKALVNAIGDKDFVGGMKTYAQNIKMNMVTAPDPRKQFHNAKDAVGDIARLQNDPDFKKLPMGKVAEEVIDLIDGQGKKLSLVNPTTSLEAKERIAQNWFSDKTKGTLRLIKPDIYDEKGNLIGGQESWFKRLTSPDVVNNMRMLTPKTQRDYVDWVETTHEELFGQNIQNIGSKDLTQAYRLSWNHARNELKVDIKGASEIQRFTGKITPIERDVLSLNKGISGLSNVYRGLSNYSQEDIDAKVLESLRLNPSTVKSISGIPAKLLTAMEEKYRVQQEEEKAKAEVKKKYSR